MPSVEDNLRQWQHYDWQGRGDEWSQVWGGTENLWWGTVYPRIRPFLPTGVLLEIAPGYGRFSQYLKDRCRRLILVDLVPRCIQACRERFRESEQVEYHVNDGRSLAMLADRSIDLAFSFDSLVHADLDVLVAYLGELGAKLSEHGVAFLHHSNVAAFRDPSTGELTTDNPHWRSTDVSADLLRDPAAAAGLACVRQELVNWGGDELTDCLSLFTRPGSRFDREYRRRENPRFMAQALELGAASDFFRTDG